MHIHYLSYLGFSTTKIKNILSTYQNGKDIIHYLKVQLDEMNDEKLSLNEKIDSLTKTINKIKQEETLMSYKVEVKELPAMFVSKRGIIRTYQDDTLLWKGLTGELQALKMKINYPSDSKTMTVFYDDGYKVQRLEFKFLVSIKTQKT